MKYINYLFILIILTLFISPNIVLSATQDPRCFTKPECIEARTTFLSKEKAAINPLYQGPDTKKVCGVKKDNNGEDVGFCYPAVQATTAIDIGGKNTFKNIGEYIQVIYTYAISAAGIIAVLVIIVSGIQWTASAGNSSVISSAKSRIVNSLVGLLIAVGSYVILNTLNPYLINFRLPQAWMIKPQVITANLCVDLADNSEISKFAKATDKKNELQINQAVQTAKYSSIKKTQPECGYQYLVKGSENICMGTICPKDNGQTQVCVNNTCIKGRISGNIINSKVSSIIPTPFTEDWGDDLVDGSETEVWIACKNGQYFEVDGVNTFFKETGSNKAEYLLQLDEVSLASGVSLCSSKTGVAGFMLRLEMDEANDFTDERHWVGKDGTNVIDLGDSYAIEKIIPKVAKDNSLTKKYLISEADMSKGFTFNIDIARIYDIDAINPFIGGDGDDTRNKAYGKTFGVSF